jgi:hypothetical protein
MTSFRTVKSVRHLRYFGFNQYIESTNILSPPTYWVHQHIGSTNILGPRDIGSTRYWVHEILGPRDIGSTRYWVHEMWPKKRVQNVSSAHMQCQRDRIQQTEFIRCLQSNPPPCLQACIPAHWRSLKLDILDCSSSASHTLFICIPHGMCNRNLLRPLGYATRSYLILAAQLSLLTSKPAPNHCDARGSCWR